MRFILHACNVELLTACSMEEIFYLLDTCWCAWKIAHEDVMCLICMIEIENSLMLTSSEIVDIVRNFPDFSSCSQTCDITFYES